MHVLLCNDDGIDAEGIQLLRQRWAGRDDMRVTTVAPDREQSATSHSLTLGEPLRVDVRGENQFAVSGTPTDCVLVALKALLLEDPPDVVVSGINHGPNMGEDVHYSGTVAAAFEGMVLGLPAVALSLTSKKVPRQFDAAIHFVDEVLPRWLAEGLGEKALLNVNIPARRREEIAGIRFCRLGSRSFHDHIVKKEDPRGRAYYWIAGDSFSYAEDEESDFVLNAAGYITATPLHADLTDYAALEERRRLAELWET
jgi:5'-nucleotidase